MTAGGFHAGPRLTRQSKRNGPFQAARSRSGELFSVERDLSGKRYEFHRLSARHYVQC